MQQGTGFLLVVLGLLGIWIVVSGKFDLMETFFLQLFDLPIPDSNQKTQNPKLQEAAGSIQGENPQKTVSDLLQEIGAPNYQVPSYQTPPFVAA